MKMKKLIVTAALVAISTLALAYPLGEKQRKAFAQNKALSEQMNKMIMSFVDMDIMMNRERELDFEILKEDAETILKAVAEIRALDKDKVFKKNLNALENPTRKMLEYSNRRDPRAGKYPEQIFNACFKCHADHRPW